MYSLIFPVIKDDIGAILSETLPYCMTELTAQDSSLPSVFMWPITGSIALRRFNSFFNCGVRPAHCH